jgi:hypothetical protein
MGIRVGMIGPRRSRTGTGPYVARFLKDCGCEVLEWTKAEASSFLTCPASLPTVDAVAICSPAETHFDYLSAAVSRCIHVFCEKPMVWPRDHSGAALRRLLANLALVVETVRGRAVLHENTQWTYTLDDYRRMTGGLDPNDIREFSCELGPSSGAPAEMIMECAPHANSLLLALGCSGMEGLSVAFRGPTDDQSACIDIHFECRSPEQRKVDVHYRFEQCANQPRPAAYALNGRWVRRRIAAPGYRIFFCHDGREMSIADPLESSVRDFVGKVLAGAALPREEHFSPAIQANLEMSAAILERTARPQIKALEHARL